MQASIFCMKDRVPLEVRTITAKLREAGFDAYLVGGCVRDMLLNKAPKDWDVTTNATPPKLQELFPDSFYENDFGTVGVKTGSEDSSLSIVEVTPYRTEGEYRDKRRPESVTFGDNLEEDLARRDFTINAIAYDDSKGHLVDPYKGQEDVVAKVIRTVGVPEERFEEDALRLMRAVRLMAELAFAIDSETAAGIEKKADNLGHISRERIRDEFCRILLSHDPMMALQVAYKLGILKYVSPALEAGIGVDQNQAHSYDVFGHLMHSVQHAADKEWALDIRLAALFHDISKPETRRWSDEKGDWTFHGHEVVGARVTKKIMEDLHFSREMSEKVVKLVRWHMFFSDPDQITLSAVRRMITNVDEENIWDLLNLRICDRIGTGRPKEQPFRFRKYKAMVEQALRDPISVSMLETDGSRLMKEFHMKPGPQIGHILNALLEEVLDDPSQNSPEYLDARTRELLELAPDQLAKLGRSGKAALEKAEEEEIRKIEKKHKVG